MHIVYWKHDLNQSKDILFHRGLPFLLMFCTGLATSSIDIYLPALPELVNLFHTTDNMLRISVMISPMVSAFTGLFYGSMSDIYGRRFIFLFCLFIFSIGSIWCGFSDSAIEFLIARLVQAIGSTGMGLLTITILSDKFKGITLARYLSIYSILYPISFTIAPNIGAFLMLHISWRGMFFFIAILALSVLALLWSILPETLNAKSEKTQPVLSLKQWLSTIYTLLKTKNIFRNMALTNALAVAMNHIFTTNAPFIFEGYFHYTKMQYANLMMIPNTFNIIGCLLYSLALRYTTPKICLNFGRLVVFLFLTSITLALSLSSHLTVSTIIIIYSICSFGISFLIMTSVGFAISDLNQDKGLGTGIIQFIRNSVSSIMVMISGYFCVGVITPVFLIMSLCALTILFIVAASYAKLPNIG